MKKDCTFSTIPNDVIIILKAIVAIVSRMQFFRNIFISIFTKHKKHKQKMK